MSAVAERSGTETVCLQCGARFGPDQDWCLECGTAVTVRIRAAPNWRVPLAIVAGVVALTVVGLVVALIALSRSSDRSVAADAAAASAAASATLAVAAGTSAATAAPAPTIVSWPTGVTGYTVILGVLADKAAAKASATKIAAAGTPVGLLHSSGYSSMRPGDWVVFSGTYTTNAQAAAAAAQLKTRGHPGAYPFSVIPAG